MIEIDGSHGEGGGQIIRSAVSMSALTGKPCHIYNIRVKRQTPGLGYQHLTAVKAVGELCDAEIKGADLRSHEIYFSPNKIKSGKFDINIGTAGSITLVLQALIPAALHAPENLEFLIIGGTNVPHAPSPEYFQHIFSDYLRQMNVKIESNVLKYGFYPRGGGKMQIKIEPCKKLKPLYLMEKGKLQKIDCWSIASNQLKEAKVAERQIRGFEDELKMKIEKKNAVYTDTFSVGTNIHSHAHYENCKLGADALGERGLPAEKVGKNCALLLKKEINGNGCIDEHMSDQLLPFMALAKEGKIRVNNITEHAKTNIYVIEQFLPVKFSIDNNIIEVKA